MRKVVAMGRRMPCIELVRHRLDRNDADLVRAQMVVDRAADHLGHGLAGQIDMRDLRQRVDAGIGSPGAEHPHAGAAEIMDRGFQRLLHREPLAWRCQPTRPAPQYSIVSL